MHTAEIPADLQSPVFEAFSKSVDKQYIYICDVKTNVWRWSPPAVEYFGLPSEYIEELPTLWLAKVHPKDRASVEATFGRLFSGEEPEHSCEYRVRNAEGKYIWVQCRGCMVSDEDGNQRLCAGILTNLEQKNKFDGTTGLCSMPEFQTALKGAVEGEQGRGGVLLVGIDHFRRLNEMHNYAFGNELLNVLAKKLSRIAPAGCNFYKLDGDKFALIYPGATELMLQEIFMRISSTGSTGLRVDGKVLVVTLTGGALLYPEHGADSETVYFNLEYAFDTAKKQNREGLTFFTEEMHEESLRRFRLQQCLRTSVTNRFEGFYLCYQPLVSADDTHTLIGAEVLLRWFHPDFPKVSPADFIPILEEFGDINEVGKWVLSTALRQVTEWQKQKPKMKISINVSFFQLKDPEFKYFVLDEVERLDYPRRQLILELTESCDVTRPEELEKELDFFRQHGIQIALDDFGTGYASLSVLRDLTADWIKVDHSFVAKIADSGFDQALTESLINLCKKLKLNVCVEGIETAEIEKVIEGYAPTVMQGYLYSRPIDTLQFEQQYINVP